MKKRIKFHGFLIFLSVIFIAVFPDYFLSRGHTGLKGALLNLLCGFFILWGYFIRISARGLKSELNPDGKTLVSAGPYKVMRNPMYFGTFLIGAGLTLMLFRWWVVLGFLIVYLAIYLPLIAGEERVLLVRFKEDFKSYCGRTSRFFPRNLAFGLPVKPEWIREELLSSLTPLAAMIFAIRAWADFKFFGSVRLQGILLILIVLSSWFLVFMVLTRLTTGKNGISTKG
jgi:protein-S-isoprenylcysteine O-methyltransferase Ste14